MAETVNVPSGPNNLRNSLVDMLVSKNMDMKMRRVVDASPAQDPNDYVIFKQLTDAQTTLQQGIDDNTKKIKAIGGTGDAGLENSLLYIQPTANLTLSTSPQNVPGLTLTLNRTGIWLIITTLGLQHSGNENNAYLVGQINIDGTATGPPVYLITPNVTGQVTTQSGGTFSTQYLYNAITQPHTVTVQAYKTSGTGNSIVGQSALSALWVRS